MKSKKNFIFVLYQTFNSDLLFWIVIDNLFLSTVKGMSAFNIILISMVGMALSLVLFPLVNLFIKKVPNKISIISASCCYILAILLFMLCNTLYAFIIAQGVYSLATILAKPASIMLKNNLKEQNKETSFVKWQSYGNLGYSIVTMVVALVAGFLFNAWAYLPVVLCTFFSVLGLVFGLIYTEPKTEDTANVSSQQKLSFKTLFSNKAVWLIVLMNVVTVSFFMFLHRKSTLLIQYVCEVENIELAKISIIVSALVLISRIFRLLSNFTFPFIYKKIKKKSNIIIFISLVVLLASVCYAIGGNLTNNIYFKLTLITLGLLIVISIRDVYLTLENKIIVQNVEESLQKQAVLVAGLSNKLGRLILDGLVLIVLSFTTLNMVYVYAGVFAVAQIFISFPLSKYLKDEKILKEQQPLNETKIETRSQI